ncbi:MAG: ribosome recycling factor [SAR86 cluster bacterium]|uniref:Ribosome-recycling factor n=1 Tax=SAR86 cluster bacterium TaxID=2030880 RepID=A0A2A5CA69_9GAMM|nr:MAG: ribosome recycling factor [SAR86 cluster bacterium]
MIEEILLDAEERMEKSLSSLDSAFNKIRTGRAHPNILDNVHVDYYGSDTPIQQVANVTVEDARSLLVTPWEKNMLGAIEKAIMSADLGLNPSNNGDVIRVPMPALTEETRKEYTKQAKHEAENSRVALRNIRRDANQHVKDLLKEKEISEDDERKAEQNIQKLTDSSIAKVEEKFSAKEVDLLAI